MGQGEQAYSLREQYEAKETQLLISELRKKKQNPRLFEYSYLCKKALECKQKFWRAGFATFEDMNLIAHKCLMDKAISAYLAKKYHYAVSGEEQFYLMIHVAKIITRKKMSPTSIGGGG